MIPPWLLRLVEKPYLIGPLTAVLILALTVLACELRRRGGAGQQWWRAALPWLVPLVTSVGMIVAVVMFGLDGAGDLASIVALVAATISLALGNIAQWKAVYLAGTSSTRDPGVAGPVP